MHKATGQHHNTTIAL